MYALISFSAEWPGCCYQENSSWETEGRGEFYCSEGNQIIERAEGSQRYRIDWVLPTQRKLASCVWVHGDRSWGCDSW